MSDENSNTDESQKTEINWQDKAKELEKKYLDAEKTKQRILEESQGYKSRLRTFEVEAEEKEKKLLQETGKYEELYNKTTQEVESWKSKTRQLQEKILHQNIDLAIKQHAPNAEYPDLVKEALFKYDLKASGEDLTLLGVEEALEDVKKKYPKMFSSDPAKQWSKKSTDSSHEPKDEKSIWDAKLASVKTQAEYDAYLKERYARQ